MARPMPAPSMARWDRGSISCRKQCTMVLCGLHREVILFLWEGGITLGSEVTLP